LLCQAEFEILALAFSSFYLHLYESLDKLSHDSRDDDDDYYGVYAVQFKIASLIRTMCPEAREAKKIANKPWGQSSKNYFDFCGFWKVYVMFGMSALAWNLEFKVDYARIVKKIKAIDSFSGELGL